MENSSVPQSVNPLVQSQPTALEKHEHLAYAEGHDADIPANDGTLKEAMVADAHEGHQDLEKNSADASTILTDDKSNGGDDEPEKDPNMVDWDGPDDPTNPMNWTTKKKWTIIGLISANTFATPLGSTIFAPGVPQIQREFHSYNTELAAFMVSVYILGFALGPIVVAPMSELYGRVYVTHVCNFLFLIFTIACAVSSDVSMFVVFRFFMGCFGSTPLTVGGGIIADVMPPEKRGAAMSIWALG